MDQKRVAEIEQMLMNRHDMLHYNMKALRRAGMDLLAEAKRLSENIQAYAFESGRVSLKCQDQSKEIESLKRQLEMAAENQVSVSLAKEEMGEMLYLASFRSPARLAVQLMVAPGSAPAALK